MTLSDLERRDGSLVQFDLELNKLHRILGVSHVIAYCTNASRGLSATAELLVYSAAFLH